MFKVKVTANLWMLMNVCPDNISWIAEPFTTKLGMVMHHYEPDKEIVLLSSRSQWSIIYSKYDFLICLMNCWSFCNQTWFDGTALWAWLFVKRSGCSVVIKVKVAEKVQHSSECSSGRYLLNCWTFCVTKRAVVMHYHGPECRARTLVCCIQVQGHS